MKIGFLFPGQGAQSVGMGKDLYDKYEEYRNVYKKVKELTGVDVEDITFNSSEEDLSQTKNTQICILTMSLAILELLKKENIQAIASCGLSLGEYSALINSNSISFEDGVKIVKTRGEIMQKLCPEGTWSMAAILGLDEEKVTKVCNEIKTWFVATAIFNCPGQIVISGEKNAIDEAIEKLKVEGAKRAIELKTSGPFHTKMLEKASIQLRNELEKVQINSFKTKVIKNIDGKEYSEDDDVKDILANHIINPVRFEDGLRRMIDMGIDTFIEIGPGKSLSGFVRKINKELKILNVNSVETLQNLINEITISNGGKIWIKLL